MFIKTEPITFLIHAEFLSYFQKYYRYRWHFSTRSPGSNGLMPIFRVLTADLSWKVSLSQENVCLRFVSPPPPPPPPPRVRQTARSLGLVNRSQGSTPFPSVDWLHYFYNHKLISKDLSSMVFISSICWDFFSPQALFNPFILMQSSHRKPFSVQWYLWEKTLILYAFTNITRKVAC